MAKSLKYYVGERFNPQFSKPYYVPKGQMTKKAAAEYEDCIYGSMVMHSFDTVDEYNQYIEQKRSEGYNIH